MVAVLMALRKLRPARPAQLVGRNPAVVVAVEFAQSFASSSEFIGIERTVAIGVEHSEEARRRLWEIAIGTEVRFSGTGLRWARRRIFLSAESAN